MKYQDFPFDEVVRAANELASRGFQVHQKYTCDGCGERLTIEAPNTFHLQGICDKCPGVVTDIAKKGCNYLVIGVGQLTPSTLQ